MRNDNERCGNTTSEYRIDHSRRHYRRTIASTAIAQGPQVMTMPRASDGHPDLSGIWQVLNTAAWDIQDHSAAKGVPAGQGVVAGNAIPYQPWAAAKKRENYEHRATADPEARCFLPGVPRLTYEPFPFQIVQTSSLVSLLYEYVHGTRLVYTDGTQHPAGHIDFWMGDSRGHWEGDTLVVDVIDFNDETWFDRAGNFHSDAMHLVERYTPDGLRSHRLRRHDRGPEGVYATVADGDDALSTPGQERSAARVRMQRVRRHRSSRPDDALARHLLVCLRLDQRKPVVRPGRSPSECLSSPFLACNRSFPPQSRHTLYDAPNPTRNRIDQLSRRG